MSGETDASVSGWTVDTLHGHMLRVLDEMDRRYQQRYEAQQEGVAAALAAQEKAVNAALIAADRAVIKAELAAEKRFESVNEFRATLSDQAATLMPRLEAESRLQTIGVAVSEIKDRINRSEGVGHGAYLAWTVAGSAVVLVLAILGFALARGGP